MCFIDIKVIVQSYKKLFSIEFKVAVDIILWVVVKCKYISFLK